MSTTADPHRPRARNRRGEGSLLRTDILAAAAALLDTGGDARAVTLRAVARRVGIAAPSIYPHFPDQPALMLDVVRAAFADLSARIRCAVDEAGDDPRQQLHAACRSYLEFARGRPERYRTMFGGAWNPVLTGSSVTPDDLARLGAEAMQILAEILAEILTACVAAGCSTSDDPRADAVALWLGLHGLAHQRAITSALPWPADIVARIAVPLSHLVG